MYPYLLQTDSITLGSYGVMLAIAYLVGRHMYLHRLNKLTKTSFKPDLLIILLLVFSVTGAKLMFLIKNPENISTSWSETLTSGTGFSSQGAILAAIIVILIFARFSRVKPEVLLDAAAPAAIIAYAIARAGCFLSGDDCYGQNSTLPWAMAFPHGVQPTQAGQMVHPLPLYEIAYSILIYFCLHIYSKKSNTAYSQFFLLLLLWGGCRFMIEFISINPHKLLGMSGSQFGALLMCLTGSAFFTFNFLKTKKSRN